MAAPQTYTAQGQGALPSGTTQYVAQQPAVYPTQPYVQQQPGVYPAAPHAQQQPRAIIITQPTFTAEATIYQTYRTEAAKRLGGVQIAAGGLSTICTVIGILINVVHGSYYHGTGIPFYVAPGIWCGAIYAIAGGLTIGAAQKKTACFIVSSMVMSIIASVFVWNQIGCGVGTIAAYANYYGQISSLMRANLALGSLLLILGVLEFISAVWTAVLACKVACCCRCCRETPMNLQYAATTQPVVTYTAGTVPAQTQYITGPTALPMTSTAIPGATTVNASAPIGPPPNYETVQEKPDQSHIP